MAQSTDSLVAQERSGMWLRAPNLRAAHGFSTRHGGVSLAPFDSLNFDDREDDPGRVAQNRRIALTALGLNSENVARLNQIHGAEVVRASPGEQTGDALVTDAPGLALAIMTADCFPILLEDSEAGVIGAAHAGWRGTLGRIAARAVAAMAELGAQPQRVAAAIGPGICGDCYEVGADVARQFQAAGLSGAVSVRDGNVHLDVLGANTQILREAGVSDIWAARRCSTDDDFFSYRRDRGRTGRMWAVIGTLENAETLTSPEERGG